MNLLYCRSFILHTNYGQSSRPHNFKNGVAQGSVLAPTFAMFTLTTSPIHLTQTSTEWDWLIIKTACVATSNPPVTSSITVLSWPLHAVSPTPPTKTWLNIFSILPFRLNRIVLPPVSCVYTTEEDCTALIHHSLTADCMRLSRHQALHRRETNVWLVDSLLIGGEHQSIKVCMARVLKSIHHSNGKDRRITRESGRWQGNNKLT